MQRPYQCLRKSGNILVAASISSLDTFNLENGKRISSWDYPLPTGTAGLVKNSTPTEIAGIGARKSDCLPADIVLPSDPPTKRRKLSNSPTTEENEFVDQNKQKISKPTEPANPMSEAPAIIALTSTRDGKHVIAVTGEDKTIRVFEHDGKGGLHQTSERSVNFLKENHVTRLIS
jgi:tRNA (guanine-N(7)-)-methyltransferase subunit TRM82